MTDPDELGLPGRLRASRQTRALRLNAARELLKESMQVLLSGVPIACIAMQGERGFRFLKDPLFLAASVTVSKPERIMALSFIMVLCLLVYRLAEVRLRARLAETQQTIPDQVHKPTAHPTMRLSSFNASKALNCSMSRPL